MIHNIWLGLFLFHANRAIIRYILRYIVKVVNLSHVYLGLCQKINQWVFGLTQLFCDRPFFLDQHVNKEAEPPSGQPAWFLWRIIPCTITDLDHTPQLIILSNTFVWTLLTNVGNWTLLCKLCLRILYMECFDIVVKFVYPL